MSGGSSSPCSFEDVADEGEEKFHPFIQAELESLNIAGQNVNTLEARLEEARIAFIEVNKERTAKLDEIVKKIGKCIEKARPFYEAKSRQKAIQLDVQRAAQMYERACSTVDAAKEMVQLAEQSAINMGSLDGEWQEVLNHATERVLKAEREKEDSEQVHLKHAEKLAKVAMQASSYERTVKNCITKSAGYFELLHFYNEKLEMKKLEIRELEASLNSAKHTYDLAMGTLENISNIIHRRRKALREKRLHPGDDNGNTPDDNVDPLLLDVPDLIRQLSVSTRHPPHCTQEEPHRESSSSLLVQTSSIHTSQSTMAVNTIGQSNVEGQSKAPSNSSQPFTYPPVLSRPVPLRPNASIRAGVVMNPLDLLRSVGLVHLAESLPPQQTVRQQQQQPNSAHPKPQQLAAAGKGLTSSSSSYSLPTSRTNASSPKTVPRSTQPTAASSSFQPNTTTPLSSAQQQTQNNPPSCPSPSLSEVSIASTGGRRIFSMPPQHDQSGRSSETEDNVPPLSDHDKKNSPNSIAQNCSTLSVTPVSLDNASLSNISPQLEREITEAH